MLKKNIHIYTKAIYKENAADLYGFFTQEELELFSFLILISGVGPQVALNLLSHFNVSTLIDIFSNENISSLTKVPKIGKSTGEKIIFEVKRKKRLLQSLRLKLVSKEDKNKTEEVSIFNFEEYLEEALSILGYQKKEIQMATRKMEQQKISIPPKLNEHIQEWIKLYLKYL